MIDAIKGHISDTKTDLNKTEAGLQELEERLDKIESNLTEWDIPKIKKEVEDLEKNLSQLKKELSGTPGEKKVDDYSSKVNDLMNALNNPNVSAAQIRGIVMELRDELRGWKNRVMSMKDEIQELETQVNSISESLSQMDALEADVHTVADVISKLVDKLLVLEQKISSVEQTQEGILKFDSTLSQALSSPPEKKSVSISDDDLKSLKDKLNSIGKKAVKNSSVAPKSVRHTSKPKSVSPKEGMPVIEEITIGDDGEERHTKAVSEKVDKTSTKSKYEDEIMDLLSKLKQTQPAKWQLYKEDLLRLLSSALDDARKRISKKKPPNEKTLNLLLSKAELGVISLEAVFDLGDYSKIEAVVRNTLQTISDVNSQLG